MVDAIITPEFRGSFVALFKPRKASKTSSKESYGMLAPLPGDSKETRIFLKKLRALADEAMAEKFGKVLKRPKHCPIIDGDTWGQDDEEDDNDDKVNQFEGMQLLRLKSNFKPDVCNLNGEPVVLEKDLYSGAWYRAFIRPWAWANEEGGRGYSLSLDSVMKVRDDEKIGGAPAAKKAFAKYLEEGEDDDDDDDLKSKKTKKKKKSSMLDDDEDDDD